jgi:hypothetical protein
MSKENAPCIGPVSLKDAYEVCPLSMKLSLDTALLKPELRMRQSDSLFYCLKLQLTRDLLTAFERAASVLRH